jgi:hypothetical protein
MALLIYRKNGIFKQQSITAENKMPQILQFGLIESKKLSFQFVLKNQLVHTLWQLILP